MTSRKLPTNFLSAMFQTPDPLLAEIEGFLEEACMAPTAFGRDALNDPGFVFGLRAGRDCRRTTADRARAQMARYRAAGEFDPPAKRRAESTPEAA